MATHRKRVIDAVEHRQPDRVPVDFGGSTASGIHCSVVERLRDRLGLDRRPVKVHEPYQMLGFIEEDLRDALDLDTETVMPVSTFFANRMTGGDDDWKEWTTPWGQRVLIPKNMEVLRLDNGDVVTFPQGDRSCRPSGIMPASSFFFDAIERQGEYDADNPDPRDNTEEFRLLSDKTIAGLARAAEAARPAGRAVMAVLPGTGLGSVSAIPGMGLKEPKGVRSVEEWYMALAALPDFVKEVFAIQTDVAVKNLERLHAAVGDGYDVVQVCGADFGAQTGPLISKCALDELFCPFYARINGWIHRNTPWKTFKHCCGAIEPFIDSFIDAGFDILNPVQCSAAGMSPERLKKEYGERIAFWGGGVDTQKTLPFGSPAEVRAQALDRCRVFSPGGGFVFTAVHNIQARTPMDNVSALFDAIREFNTAGR